MYGATGTTPGQQVVVTVKCVVGAIAKYPDQCVDDDRVTDDALAVSFEACLAGVNSAAIGNLAPVKTIVQPKPW